MDAPVIRKDLLDAVINSDKSVSKVEIKEVTLGPGVKAPLHIHPCPTMGVVTDGSILFQIEGQEASLLKAGDAFYEPENVRVAKFDNEENIPAKFVVFYLLGRDENKTIHILAK
jgi:quercetin dioxygenase-like cupin family protein